MKVCDLTQFYSPASGGVRRYLSEKTRFVREETEKDEHLLVVPGERDEILRGERSRLYTIQSPLISRTSRYRVLLRLEAVERILESERPDIIESGDPYQVAWKAVHSSAALGIPAVGFYHSHFPEAYVRTVEKFLGATVTALFMDFSRSYVRSLYNRFERTLVPSPALGRLLTEWGVRNVTSTDLGVDAQAFHPTPQLGEDVLAELGIPHGRILLLYVGRLAQEKNTHTLFAAFRQLPPDRFHLIVVGDGLQRSVLEQLRREKDSVTWLAACADSARLAQLYRAADLFVHPGVQETFGLVALEAQACGTPVVGIRGSYMDRIIFHEQESWACENTPEALADAIEQLSDKKLSILGGGAAADTAANLYSWPRVFEQLFCIYREVCANYRRS